MRTIVIRGELHCTQQRSFPYETPPEEVGRIRDALVRSVSESYSVVAVTNPTPQIIAEQYVIFAVGLKRRSTWLQRMRWRMRRFFGRAS